MQIAENVSLQPFHTFHIPVTARYLSSFTDAAQISSILDFSKKNHASNRLVLGGGSNILFTKNFDGMVLKNEIRGITITEEDEEHVYIKAGAGENWHQFVMHCIQKKYAGIENLALIPGQVGASPMQNIGAYGVEIKDVFHELEAVHIQDLTLQKFSKSACAFGYRDSVFKSKYKNQFVITSVTFRLNKVPVFHTSYGAVQQELGKMGIQELGIDTIAQAIINIRSSKLPDPKDVGNAGSFFKNPQVSNSQFQDLLDKHPQIIAFPVGTDHTKLAAGWLIEQCGWKGYRKGDAGCYPKQALVLVNYANATGTEIYDLSEQIILSVQNKFGVLLEREVNII